MHYLFFVKRRNTPAKQAILKLLETSKVALSQDMIEDTIKGEVDRVTIYRVLNRFCEDGIAHRAVSEEGKSYYALCRHCDDNHHQHDHFHFKCINCEKVECLKETVTLKLPRGYRFASMNCWVNGYCNDCRKG